MVPRKRPGHAGFRVIDRDDGNGEINKTAPEAKRQSPDGAKDNTMDIRSFVPAAV